MASDWQKMTNRLIAHPRFTKQTSRAFEDVEGQSLDQIEMGEARVEDHSTTSKHGRERAPRIRPQQLQTHPLNPTATQFSKQGEAIAVCASSTATAPFAPDITCITK